MKTIDISDKALAGITLKRLQNYVEAGKRLLRTGTKTGSYQQLADETHIAADQVISDLEPAARPVTPGSPLDIETLVVDIERILLHGNRETVIVAGTREKVGKLINSWEFGGYNFDIEAVYSPNGIPAHAMQYEMLENDDELAIWSRATAVSTAVINAGYEEAQIIANKIVKLGIRHIWNFSPVMLNVPPGVEVENVIPGYPKWRSYPAGNSSN